MFSADQIDPQPTPGRQGRWLYRRVQLPHLRYDGIVRYEPELEELVPDVREYIAVFLNGQAQRLGPGAFEGRLYSPVTVPLPDDDGS